MGDLDHVKRDAEIRANLAKEQEQQKADTTEASEEEKAQVNEIAAKVANDLEASNDNVFEVDEDISDIMLFDVVMRIQMIEVKIASIEQAVLQAVLQLINDNGAASE